MQMLILMARQAGAVVLALAYKHPVTSGLSWFGCNMHRRPGKDAKFGRSAKSYGRSIAGELCDDRNQEGRALLDPSWRRIKFAKTYAATGVPVVWNRHLYDQLLQAQPRTPMEKLLVLKQLVSHDGLHATAAAHAIFARLALLALLDVRRACDAHAARAARPRRRPLKRDSSAVAVAEPPQHSVCSFGSNLLAHLPPASASNASSRWQYSVERADKPGLIASVPGSVLLLHVGVRNFTAGAHVHIGYLRSWEHMGTARLSCRQGCTCADGLVIDGHWSRRQRVSLQSTFGFAVSLYGPECVLAIEVLPLTRSGEHKVKITSVVVVTPELQRIYDNPTNPDFHVTGNMGFLDDYPDVESESNVLKAYARMHGGGKPTEGPSPSQLRAIKKRYSMYQRRAGARGGAGDGGR